MPDQHAANPLVDVADVRAIGEGLKGLAASIREFPGRSAAELGLVEKAWQAGAVSGGLVGLIAGLILAAIWVRLGRGRTP